jgi:hypothetical protein
MRAAGLVAALVAASAGAIAAAAARAPWLVAALLALTALIEVVLARASPEAARLLQIAGAGRPLRLSVRMLAVVLGTAVAAAVMVALEVGADAMRALIVRVRRLPLLTRGLDLSAVSPNSRAHLPALPPTVVMEPRGLDAVAPVVAAIGLAIACHRSNSAPPAAVGLAVASALTALPVGVLGLHLAALIRGRVRTRVTEASEAAIAALAPEVVLYFAATPAELYQVRMWLDPIKRLDRRALILLRSVTAFEALGDVGLPVACSPYNGTIASLRLADPVVALFVTHSGNNLSMLRRPGVRSVFVGHGDSDKPDSVNPFARVYDEVWVAGPLGRRRYAVSAVGVEDAAIVEIGRPQLPATLGGDGRPATTAGEPITIVYAPTWEGWGDDPHHSSLAHIGPALLERLSSYPGVRVRYRPHPLTGRRDPALRAAHLRIVTLVGRVPEDEPLTETFAQAAALVGDVSSVVGEFLPYDRPYAVVDTRGLGTAAFVDRFPSTAGGFVLPATLDGLDEVVAVARGDAADQTAVRRRALVTETMGDPATSQQRFAAAIERLLGRPAGRAGTPPPGDR